MTQINAMGATLRAQRLGALEATTLLRKVMEEIDVAIFAFDGDNRLRLVNRAGERLLGRPSERMLNDNAQALGLAEYLAGDETADRPTHFRWRGWTLGHSPFAFREGGLPHQLLVVTDLTRALREEELQAWQRLVRVLGHELNNSLAPIKSIAGSLETMLAARRATRRRVQPSRLEGRCPPRTIDHRLTQRRLEPLHGRLRAAGQAPAPATRAGRGRPVDSARSRAGERMPLTLHPGPAVEIQGDRDQLEQRLINLLRNAVDASLETGGGVTLSWSGKVPRWRW